jgi:hypothetical protein
MLADIIKSVKEAVSTPDVKSAIDELLGPCIQYADQRIKSIQMLFQVISILILIQCCAVLFLIIMEIRRNTAN